MKAIKSLLIICLLFSIVFMSACGEQSSDVNVDETAETVDFEEKDLIGTWKATNGTPLALEKNGIVKSTAANLTGSYTITKTTVEVTWENGRSETYKITETDGELTLVYGEEPLAAYYKKES